MRTYSHALLTWAAAERVRPPEPGIAAWAVMGAVLPDLPAVAGAACLVARRRRRFTRSEFCQQVCAEGPFGAPDAALHSALPVPVLLTLCGVAGAKTRAPLLAFLLGWAGHVVVDALTHAGDARPVLWPISEWRFESPISYWDRARYARLFTLLEHAAALASAAWLLGPACSSPSTSTPWRASP